MDGAEFQELVSSLDQFTVSRYLLGASFILSVYDWLLLSGDESVTIWRTRWTLPKGIYYFAKSNSHYSWTGTRYISTHGSPDNISVAAIVSLALPRSPHRLTAPIQISCTVYTYVNGLLQLFSMFLSNLLLTLRLVALYKRNRWASWFLYTFLVISYVISAILIVVSLHSYEESIGYSLVFHACGSNNRSPLMPAIFAVPSAFEFTIFFLTGFRAWKDARNMTSLSNTPFLTILYRDGIVSFFVMFGVRMWNIWIYATQPLASAFMGVYLLWAVMTILSTRVYLNLVFLAHSPALLEPTEVSRAQFASRSHWGGIKMRVQTTTIGDSGEVLSFGDHEVRPPMPSTKFDTTFGIDSVLHADSSPVWNDRASKKEGSGSHPPLRRHSSHRPFSSLSFVQPTPEPLIYNDKV